MNNFEYLHGSNLLKRTENIGVFLIGIILSGYLIAFSGIKIVFLLITIPLLLTLVAVIFYNPRNGIIALLFLNYFVMGIYRYLPIIPWGLTIDGLIVLIYLSLFLKSFQQKIPWANAKSDLVLVSVIWYLYAFFELFNPEAQSRIAWFYGFRGISLYYQLLVIPLIIILFNKQKDINLFFLLWGIFSILGTLKGMQQKFIGVDSFEQRWLDEGAAEQHIIWGQLRVFSLYSDAGQSGAAQGQSGVVFCILAFGEKNFKKKIFYSLVALLGLYGMMLSGTRGAIAVPFVGFAFYILLRKKFKAILIGALCFVGIVIFFKYTNIGQGNAIIARMRTAFNPDDPSLQVRLLNQQRLKAYLATRPFGGGLGSTESVGTKYSPGSFLAQVPADSWYVKIWMETGIVGLMLYLSIMLYILGKSCYYILFIIRDDWLRNQSIALTAGLAGMLVAAYGNSILGQFPSNLIVIFSMIFTFLFVKLDTENR